MNRGQFEWAYIQYTRFHTACMSAGDSDDGGGNKWPISNQNTIGLLPIVDAATLGYHPDQITWYSHSLFFPHEMTAAFRIICLRIESVFTEVG